MKKRIAVVTAMVALASACICPIAAEKPVEIEFWYGLGGTMGETMEEMIADFNASQDEVVVTGVVQSGYNETAQMIQAAVASGDVPACYLGDNYTSTEFASKGVLEYMDDYIAADPDFNQDDIIDSFMQYCRDDEGHVYSLPVWGATQVIYYRKDMFEEAGLDPDEVFATWQNVAEGAKKLQEFYGKGAPDFYGFELMGGSNNLEDMGYSNGGSIISEDEKTVTFANDEFVEALEAARKWIHEDKVFGFHFGGDGWEYWYKTIDDVMEGRAGGYVGSSGDQGDLDFSIIGAHVQPGFNDHPANPYVDPVAVAIMEKASEEEKAAAFQWLSYLNKEATKTFSMKTGYVPVRSSVRNDPEYKAFLEENPQAIVPIEQAEIGRRKWTDFTNEVTTAFYDACDLIEIENVPAREALEEAAEMAQQVLDEYWEEHEE